MTANRRIRWLVPDDQSKSESAGVFGDRRSSFRRRFSVRAYCERSRWVESPIPAQPVYGLHSEIDGTCRCVTASASYRAASSAVEGTAVMRRCRVALPPLTTPVMLAPRAFSAVRALNDRNEDVKPGGDNAPRDRR
jgi:hypothetical protein